MTEQEQIDEIAQIRIKTAEEFAKRVCEMLWNLGSDNFGNRFSYGDLTSKNVLYIAKQFGVDIDDNSCQENNIATAHINRLVRQDAEIERLKAENKQLKEKAVQDFVEKLKEECCKECEQAEVEK